MVCYNTIGGFECVCSPGTLLNTSSGQCFVPPAPPTTPPPTTEPTQNVTSEAPTEEDDGLPAGTLIGITAGIAVGSVLIIILIILAVLLIFVYFIDRYTSLDLLRYITRIAYHKLSAKTY